MTYLQTLELLSLYSASVENTSPDITAAETPLTAAR